MAYVEMSLAPDFARTGGRKRGARSYRAFVPEPIAELEPALTSATAARAEDAAAKVRALNTDSAGLLALEGLGRQLLRSEALASSQIEGLGISHRKLAEADLQAGGNYRAREIVAAIKALERSMAIGAAGSAPLDIATIRAIHREIAIVPPLDRIAGQIRTEPSWIGGTSPADAEYVGPPHEQVEPLLRDLCRFMNRDDLSPVAQAAIAHAQFEIIHPFGDGNGRVGRCLIHVLLLRRGVAKRYVPPISLVLGADKDSYISGLEAFREGRLDEWIGYFAGAVELAAARAIDFSEAVGDLQTDWRNRLGPMRSDSAVLPIIEILPRYPVLTTPIVEKEIGRSRPATIAALARLESIGALTRHRNQKKGDSWEAKELFELLADFETEVRRPAL
jgi:Fic family protein